MPSSLCSDARAELGGFGAQLFVGELLYLRLKGIDGVDNRQQALDGALIRGAEYFGESLIEKHGISIYKCKCIETRGGVMLNRRMRACALFRSFEAQDQALKILAIADAPQLTPEMFLRRVGAAFVIVIRLFALLNLRFGNKGLVWTIRRREKHQRSGRGLGRT